MMSSLLFEQNLDNSLIVTPAEFKQNYLFGLKLETQDGLRTMLNETIVQKLLNAQRYTEDMLDLKLKKQIIHESRDFNNEEYRVWGYVKTSYLVSQAFELQGWLNNQLQITYPPDWISSKVSTDDTYYRQIYLVPNASTVLSHAAIFTGLIGNIGLLRYSYIPNYWRVTYCTGFSKVPQDVKDFICKRAAIDILTIMGDIVLGAGIAAKSIHFDGLTQRISTTQGNGNNVFSPRIKVYERELEDLKSLLIRRYKGITMHAM